MSIDSKASEKIRSSRGNDLTQCNAVGKIDVDEAALEISSALQYAVVSCKTYSRCAVLAAVGAVRARGANGLNQTSGEDTAVAACLGAAAGRTAVSAATTTTTAAGCDWVGHDCGSQCGEEKGKSGRHFLVDDL